MRETKVISVRLPEDVIDKLDSLASKSRYWKRNTVISALIRNVLRLADEHTLWKILRDYPSTTETSRIEHVIQSTRY